MWGNDRSSTPYTSLKRTIKETEERLSCPLDGEQLSPGNLQNPSDLLLLYTIRKTGEITYFI